MDPREKGLIMDTYVRHQQDWIVPRRVMCGFFWTGIILLFTGIILLVTSKHKGAVYQSWGAVLLGLGFCLLLICLILCLHAYCVITVSDQEAELQQQQPFVRRLAVPPPPGYALANGRKPIPVQDPDVVSDAAVGATDDHQSVQIHSQQPKEIVIVEKEQPTGKAVLSSGHNSTDIPHESNGGIKDQTKVLQQDSFENNCSCDIKLDKRKSSNLTQALDDVLDDIDKNYGPMGSSTEKEHTVRFSLSNTPDVNESRQNPFKSSPKNKSKYEFNRKYEDQLGKSYRSFNEDVDCSIDQDLDIKPVCEKHVKNVSRKDDLSASSLNPSNATTSNSNHDGLVMIHPSHSQKQISPNEKPPLERQHGYFEGNPGNKSVEKEGSPPLYDDVDRRGLSSSAAYERGKKDSISAEHDVVHPEPVEGSYQSQPGSTIPPPYRPEPKVGMTSIGVQYSPPLSPVTIRRPIPVKAKRLENSEIQKPKQTISEGVSTTLSFQQGTQAEGAQSQQLPSHSPHSKHRHHQEPPEEEVTPQEGEKQVTARPPKGPPGNVRNSGPAMSKPPRMWPQGVQAFMEQRAAAAAAAAAAGGGASSNPSAPPGEGDTPEISLSKISLYDNVQYSAYEVAAIARAAAASKKDVQHFHF